MTILLSIRELKKGELFKKKETAKKTFEKGIYCRENKAYECANLEDISDFIYLKGEKKIFPL